MDFITISEYFYKLFSRIMVILLLPIIAFIAIYLRPVSIDDYGFNQDYLVIAITLVVCIWLGVFFFFNKKIKTIRNGQGLRLKLEKYFQLTIVRFIVFSFCSMLLSVAFYFSRNDLFTMLFVVQLALCGILWPTASKTSSDLKLRGDEREMVYYKKDVL